MGFKILLLLIVDSWIVYGLRNASSSDLPAPSNVSLSCHNEDTVVYWNYTVLPHHHSTIVFQLKLIDHHGETVVNTTHLQYNITSLLGDPRYNWYYVNVTAIIGSRVSGIAKSRTFTFNKRFSARISCDLDLPAVNMSLNDDKLVVWFTIPRHLHSHAVLKNARDDPLTFRVKTEENPAGTVFKCQWAKEPCRGTVPIPHEKDQYCANVTREVGGMGISQHGEICVKHLELHRDDNIKQILIGVFTAVAFMFMLLIIVGFISWDKVKKKTPSILPKILVLQLTNTHRPQVISRESIADVRVEPTSVDLLLKQTAPEEGELKESHSWEISQNEMSSGYDRPHVLRVEINPGEILEGYGAR